MWCMTPDVDWISIENSLHFTAYHVVIGRFPQIVVMQCVAGEFLKICLFNGVA